MFFCEFCENFQNTFFHRTSPMTASQKAQNKFICFCLNLPASSHIDPSHKLASGQQQEQNTVLRILFLSTGMELYHIHEMFKPSFCKYSTDSIEYTSALNNCRRKNLSFLGPEIQSEIDPSIMSVKSSCFMPAFTENILLHLQS